MPFKLTAVIKSNNPDKKWDAIFTQDGHSRTISFGARGYTDYTLGATREQRDAYRARHNGDLKGNPMTAGYLSYYILWGASRNMKSNIADYRRLFGL
jgi:hypothetical protein